jgi:hypothetical protein
VGGQQKKKGSRVTPKGGGPTGRLTSAERAGLEDIFERILRSAPKDLIDELPPLAVEMWASQMWSIWATSELIGMDAVEVFAGGLIKHAAKRATPAALMAIRALGAVAPEPYGSRARREAERLASTGVAEPRWAAVVGTGEPTVAWLTYDPIDDDGVSVMVGFDGPAGPSTIGVYVDHNLGGMAKDVFALPDGINEVLAELQEDDDESGPVDYREISLDEAAARWTEALEMTDMTLDPPTSEDFDDLRALVMARLSKLPRGRGVPVPSRMSEEERDQLLDQFFESDETVGLWGLSGEDNEDDAIEHLADQILAFSLDCVLGTPLRFSPVMVEIFCLDWAPGKVAIDGDGFTLLPDVLAAWIRFVGRRRGIPEEAITDATEAAYGYAPEMIELSLDPEEWGPAKTFALAIQQRGIDLTDQAALDDFVDEVNRNGGIDVLADSLVESIAPTR